MADSSGSSRASDNFLTMEGDISLSDERRAALAPKLQALLDDLRKLEELEAQDLEPLMLARRWKGSDDAG